MASSSSSSSPPPPPGMVAPPPSSMPAKKGGGGGILKTTTTTTTRTAGLPSADNPTRPYWLREPSERLLGHRTTEGLPEEADVVIVGSGITGSFAARFLLGEEEEGKEGGEKEDGENKGTTTRRRRRRRRRKVLLLEAREAVSGATGRNGGHCQPLVYGAVPEVAEFEIENFEFLKRLVEKEKIDCDWVSLTGVHGFYSQHMLDLAASSVSALKQSHPSLGSTLELILAPSDLLTKHRVPTALGAVIQHKAASLWPYKFVAHVLESLLSTYPPETFNLQTNTPVTSLLAPSESGAGWTVTTPRGQVKARQVLLATNGYTSHLLPAFSDLIVPVRGQVASLIPPTKPAVQLDRSYVFAADPQDDANDAADAAPPAAPMDDYLVQRPLPTGEVIFGGGRRFASSLGVGVSDDNEVEPTVAEYLRSGLTPVLDLDDQTTMTTTTTTTSSTGNKKELEASFEWTGIMGYSRDLHAWVGSVPESLGGDGAKGLWVCAGYTGHGMPAAALSARAVAREILGLPETMEEEEEEKGELPEEFRISEERVVRARELPLVEGGWEVSTFGTLFSGVLGEGEGNNNSNNIQ